MTQADAKHVLLIEDEPNIIEAVSFILTRNGWNVTTHSNGHDAVETTLALVPDAVILDVMLPGKSGFDILGELRQAPQLAEVPVMMLTARGQKKDRDLAERLGVTRFMTKPFSNSEILNTLNDMTAQ